MESTVLISNCFRKIVEGNQAIVIEQIEIYNRNSILMKLDVMIWIKINKLTK